MSAKKIKPLGNRILVKRSEATTSQGGILLPDAAQEKPKLGEVLAVGPGASKEDGSNIPMEVAIGDYVLFGAYAGTEVNTDEDAEYLIMSEDDVLAIKE